jgi:hypothetical protein
VVFKDAVKNKVLRHTQGEIGGREKYAEARRIIEEAGLTNADEVLAHLGLREQWKGLVVEEARIGLQQI